MRFYNNVKVVLQIIWRFWENHSELGGFFFMNISVKGL